MTEEDDEDCRSKVICRFCDKNFEPDNIRDHCHLTGNYRGTAHSKCNINVTQKQSNFAPFTFHNYYNYDFHMFFKILVDKKKNKINFQVIPETNEEFKSVTYGCIRFIDSFRFLSTSLDGLVKNFYEDGFKILKKDFQDEWQFLKKTMAYPYKYFINIDAYKRPVDNLRKEYFFSKLKNKCLDDEKIKRTKEFIKIFNIKKGEDLTHLYLKSDVVLLADDFEKFINKSIEEYGINPLYCVSLPRYTWQGGMNYTDIKFKKLQNRDMIL